LVYQPGFRNKSPAEIFDASECRLKRILNTHPLLPGLLLAIPDLTTLYINLVRASCRCLQRKGLGLVAGGTTR
jgi:hypothetical protein